MDRYVRLSRIAREIYCEYSPCVEPYGLDENWLDLTGSGHIFGDGQQVANTIRERILKELGITVSIGVSFNKSMAKLGSDLNKPNGTCVITRENMKERIWPLPASDLLFVGPATTKKLRNMGIYTIGDLTQATPDFIRKRLGKHGLLVWNYANGIDDDPVNEIGYQHHIKSVGNSITAAHDLVTEEDIRTTVMLLKCG